MPRLLSANLTPVEQKKKKTHQLYAASSLIYLFRKVFRVRSVLRVYLSQV